MRTPVLLAVIGCALGAITLAGAQEPPAASPDPGLYAAPSADTSPTGRSCDVDTLLSGKPCLFEAQVAPAADPARQGAENARAAAALADRACTEVSRPPVEPKPDKDVLALCKRDFLERAAGCGADGSAPLADSEGRFSPAARLCYAALGEALARARTMALVSARCCRCLAKGGCARSAEQCNVLALHKELDEKAERCLEGDCHEACWGLIPQRAPPGELEPLPPSSKPAEPDLGKRRAATAL